MIYDHELYSEPLKFDGKQQMYVSNARIYGVGESIHAAGYPMVADLDAYNEFFYDSAFELDVDLATGTTPPRFKKLGKTGTSSGHANFLKGCIVQFDITTNQQIFQQLLRYIFLVPVSSQSKMHRGTSIDFKYDPFVTDNTKLEVQSLKSEFERAQLDFEHERTVATREIRDIAYLTLLSNLPTGTMLTMRFSTNYLSIKNIVLQRRNHRLPGWREFEKFARTLPGFNEIID